MTFQREWIEKLSSNAATERMAAAGAIYAAGRQLAEDATRSWWHNPEFAQLCNPHPTVGLAVTQENFARIRETNDFPRLAEVPPDQDASEFELHFDQAIAVDVLTTRDPQGSGAIAKFLARQGEGIQQVEFRCSDVDRATALLRQHFAIAPVYPQKRPGADGTHVNFFLVSAPSSSKVLIELYEPCA